MSFHRCALFRNLPAAVHVALNLCFSFLQLNMADDHEEMAVLLQEAVSEMKESRKQTKALLEQNEQLVRQNSVLAEKVMEVVEGCSRRTTKATVKVSVHTKVTGR